MTLGTLCAQGHYCPGGGPGALKGPTIPTVCPAGYMTAHVGRKTSVDCEYCTNGRYCEAGSLEPKGKCDAGYYCFADVPNAVSTPSDRKCEAGTYCPAGSILPSLCPPGKYGAIDSTALRTSEAADSPSSCLDCPSGQYCPAYGLTDATDSAATKTRQPCPDGYLCFAGAKHPS